MSSFKEKFAEYIRFTEDNLRKYNAPADGETAQKDLISAMNYSLEAGGKRIRPTLVYAFCEACGGDFRKAAAPAAAIEMIHTFSLIHDDLPAMDNDEYRRGKKTTHVVYGEAMAILAGDALLNLAYETASKAFELEPANPAVGRAFGILAAKTGIYGMIGGQSVDVEYEGKPLTEEQLCFIYRLKTSALIEASMMIGAVLAGACDEDVEKIEQIARKVGMAFQIQDDILDVIGDADTLGKATKSDEKNNKTTYVSVKGLEQAQKDVAEYSKEAVTLLEELPYENEFLKELILNLIHRNA